MVNDAENERPSTDRLDRMMAAEFQREIHQTVSDIHQELAGFRLQIIWLSVASLLSTP